MASFLNTPDQRKKLRAIWRHAAKHGEAVLVFPTAKDGQRFRFALYEAVRGLRDHPGDDQEAADARNSCFVKLDEGTVTVMRKDRDPVWQQVEAYLGQQGIAPADLDEGQEEELAGILARVQAKLDPAPATAATPAAGLPEGPLPGYASLFRSDRG